MVMFDIAWVESLDQEVNQRLGAGQHPQWVLEQILDQLYRMAQETE